MEEELSQLEIFQNEMIPLRLQTVPLQLFEIGVWISTQTSTKQLPITSVNSGFKNDFEVLVIGTIPDVVI